MSIQNGRSNTSGNLPVSIPNDGQIFVQQADGIFLTRRPDGTVRQTLMAKRIGVADAGYTVKRWDTYVGISSLTGPHAVQLPAASAYPAGQPLVIADESGNCSASNQITILPAGADTISGAVSLPQTAPNFGSMLFSDGVSKWTAAQFTANNSAALAAAVTAAQNAQTAAETAVSTLGQCRLNYVSPTQLLLKREGGRLLFINGSARLIPSGGVTAGNSGIGGSSLCFVYALMSGSSMTLEVVTTPPDIDPTYSVLIKQGDPTRTLVGALVTAADGSYQGGCSTLSYYNRRDLAATTGQISPGTTATQWSILQGSLLYGLCWSDEALDAEFTGSGGIGNVNAGVYANMRTIIGDTAVSNVFAAGPQSRAGGQPFVSGGLASRAVIRLGGVQPVAAWAQGFTDSGVTGGYILSGTLKTRG